MVSSNLAITLILIINLFTKSSLELNDNALSSINSRAIIDVLVLILIYFYDLQIIAEFYANDLIDVVEMEFLMCST